MNDKYSKKKVPLGIEVDTLLNKVERKSVTNKYGHGRDQLLKVIMENVATFTTTTMK